MPGPPSIFLTILDHPDRRRHDLSSLRLVIVGAAAIPVELIRRIRDELGLDSIVTGYGLTESTGIVTHVPLRRRRPRSSRPPPVARFPASRCGSSTMPGTTWPAGEPGEILVRGYTVMQGYLDDPEQTAAAIDGDGWLHTGDIGVLTDDRATWSITDRKKDMFIVGGFNAYPAEIENVMMSHPAVGQVAVIGVPDERLGEVGMAFVVRRPRSPTTTDDEIIAWCREQMANYKVPRARRASSTRCPLNARARCSSTSSDRTLPGPSARTLLVLGDTPVAYATTWSPSSPAPTHRRLRQNQADQCAIPAARYRGCDCLRARAGLC